MEENEDLIASEVIIDYKEETIEPADVDSAEIVEVERVGNFEIQEEVMSKSAAQELTKDIQSTSTALYVLLKKAHDNKAWVSMGYSSWSEYISNEFQFSRSRSYQLINQASVIEEINEASGVPMYISERDARSIKNRLPEITEKIKDVDKEGLEEQEVKEKVKDIIDEEREEIDNAKNFNGEQSGDAPLDEREDSGNMEEWQPDGIDMDKMKRMFSEENQFFYDNLLNTLKVFESMPDPVIFGGDIKDSHLDEKEVILLAHKGLSWITKLLDTVE